MESDSKTQREYIRALPGGGFVAIDVAPVTSLLGRRHFCGRLIVERRTGWRCEGHSPPGIAEVWGKTIDSVVRKLLPAAECNPAIGAALLRRNRVAR